MPSQAEYFVASCALAAMERQSSAAAATTELRYRMAFPIVRRAASNDACDFSRE
jgi:hypothetical protein